MAISAFAVRMRQKNCREIVMWEETGNAGKTSGFLNWLLFTWMPLSLEGLKTIIFPGAILWWRPAAHPSLTNQRSLAEMLVFYDQLALIMSQMLIQLGSLIDIAHAEFTMFFSLFEKRNLSVELHRASFIWPSPGIAIQVISDKLRLDLLQGTECGEKGLSVNTLMVYYGLQEDAKKKSHVVTLVIFWLSLKG